MRSPFDWPRGPFRSADGDGLASYALVVDENGNYLRGPDGRYLIYSEA